MTIKHFIHVKIRIGQIVRCKVLPLSKKFRERLQNILQIFDVVILQVIELGVVAEADKAVAEVHGIVDHHVHSNFVLLRLSVELELASKITQDGVGLSELDIALNKAELENHVRKEELSKRTTIKQVW